MMTRQLLGNELKKNWKSEYTIRIYSNNNNFLAHLMDKSLSAVYSLMLETTCFFSCIYFPQLQPIKPKTDKVLSENF